MSLTGNGIFVVRGEMSILLTAMRRGGTAGGRWSHNQQDEEEPLTRTFQELREVLSRVHDLRLIDPMEFLEPFLEVIRTEDTTGPITSLALGAVNKFLSYGLIDPTHASIPSTVHSIADAVTHARFIGTDQSSDGVVLLKILQVLKTLTLSPEGAALTNESLCDIMMSGFKICFETRLSDLLRGTAEYYLRDMIQLVFMRLPQFPEVFTGNFKQLKMRTGSMEQGRTRKKSKSSYKSKAKPEVKLNGNVEAKVNAENGEEAKKPITIPVTVPGNIVDMQGSISQGFVSQNNVEGATCQDESAGTPEVEAVEDLSQTVATPDTSEENVQDFINQRGIRFTPQHPDDVALVPYGLACVYELFRFLISLCNPLDKQNTDVMIHLGLTLLTTAFEVGADSIGKYSSLLALVKDDLCRNLFSLLNTDRLSIFAADLQVSFLMFEALRTHLKFQLEYYLTKLIEMIVSESPKVTYEYKEIALDNILNLWRIPGFTTELYLNYDCNMYCTNLYEDLTKLLSRNAYPAGVYNTHLLSLDALLTVIESVERHCNEKTVTMQESESGVENINKFISPDENRFDSVGEIPKRSELIAIKDIKKWLPTGTEYFNQKPKKGIQFLQEHGVLKQELDPHEICTFLRENPALDKKQIGEYISGRSNLQVLDCFVKMFDFTETRIDEALRLYLETFRLPGEAPLIALLLEHFAEHWHKCNGEPFVNADAAFTLAYAVIMLNVDQHNHNVKKQNNPMTREEYKKNLTKVNAGNDFDQDMLDEIYTAIKGDEIVMPAEQTGLVRENYLWKVLLRRGVSKDGVYTHVSGACYDIDLFSIIWGPIISALSYVFDKSDDLNVCRKAMLGFERCAAISSHFGMTEKLDVLMQTLSKYTMLYNQPKLNNLTAQFGANSKSQMALRTTFNLTHQHGDNVRDGWKHLFDLILTMYTMGLLPRSYVEAEDFIESSGKIAMVYESVQLQKQESGLFSSLYSYMVSSENISRIPSQEEQEYIDLAKLSIKECGLEQVISDSKFLHEESLLELVKALIELSRGPDVEKSLGYMYNENVTVFFLELLIKIVLQNRDRVMVIWSNVHAHLYTLITNASHFDYQFLLERSVIGLLRLAIRLMRNEDMSPVVLQSLRMLLLLKSAVLFRISRQISFGLYELLKTSAQNIHTRPDWSIVFTLLECVGAGAQPPKPITDESQTEAKSEGEGVASSGDDEPNDRGYTSDSELSKRVERSQSPILVPAVPVPQNNPGGWILVGNEGEVQPVLGRTPPAHQYSISLQRNLGPHDPIGLVKCCESLAFLVRDVAHITPYNFDDCVHCIRTFVEASLQESKRRRTTSRSRPKHPAKRKPDGRGHRSPASSPDEDDQSDDELPGAYHQVTIQLLDLMHTLHTRTAQIFRWWAEEGGEIAEEISLWTQGWCPLLQGIARLCCDTRKQIRMSAITYLQRALLVHDLQTLTGPEWEACFNRVLFPLLNQLLQPIVGGRDTSALEETRMRAATVLSKVFLHHLTPLLSLETFPQLWLSILDYLDKYMHADKSDLLAEAIPESLKNILLVMESAGVFETQRGPLWTLTWERIDKFLPGMKDELFKEKTKEIQIEEAKVEVQEDLPKQVTQHNIENATRSSIILQPPSSNAINSPLFAHLGQMVSTPIGPSNVEPQTNNHVPNANHPQHTFPILYSPPSETTQSPPPPPPPVSLYSEYINNPYNVQENPFPNSFNTSATDRPVCDSGLSGTLAAPPIHTRTNVELLDGNCNQNVFQSSNYFYAAGPHDENIPPGSEILYGSQQFSAQVNHNIPISETSQANL